MIKKLLPHLVVPCVFTLFSFFVYTKVEESIGPDMAERQEMITGWESMAQLHPEAANRCGVEHFLNSARHGVEANRHLLSGLKGFLVEGSLGLLVLSLFWQAIVVSKQSKE